jgi:predicted nucleotidyltransferase component of viral defense system
LIYRFDSEGGIPLRLKVEVNCREHHTIFGIQDVKHAMQSEWYTGEVLIPTYELAELLRTKMRALYQRRKGRDLFDMWFAITQKNVDPNKIIEAWNFYMKEENDILPACTEIHAWKQFPKCPTKSRFSTAFCIILPSSSCPPLL